MRDKEDALQFKAVLNSITRRETLIGRRKLSCRSVAGNRRLKEESRFVVVVAQLFGVSNLASARETH